MNASFVRCCKYCLNVFIVFGIYRIITAVRQNIYHAQYCNDLDLSPDLYN